MDRKLLITALFTLLIIMALTVILVRHFFERRDLPAWTKTLAIAHRGLHNTTDAPENSLAAFQEALKHGYAMEFDVMLSQDNEVVVFHDDTLQRMTGVSGRVDATPLKTLKTVTLAATSQTIPTLKELLNTINGHVPLYVEIKKDGPAGVLEEKVAELLDQYGGPFIILSFNTPTLLWFQKQRPHFFRAQNVDLVPGNILKNVVLMITHAYKANPDLVIYDGTLLPRHLSKAFSKYIIPVTAYNVKSLEDVSHFQDHAHNIIFDHIKP